MDFKPIMIWRRATGLVASLSLVAVFYATPAAAVPSFARQTGLACTQCHTGGFGPQLNDYGRQFKLNGYAWGDADTKVPPLSAMAIASFTHTAEAQAGGAASGYSDNDNAALDQVSLFYAGRILSNFGAMIQGTYDGIAKHFTIDNIDLRYANQATIAQEKLVYGVSLNNNPTSQDLWNSTPAWGFPFAASNLAPSPGATTLIEGGFAQQVAGLTAYAMWNDLIYVEGGAYSSLSGSLQSSLGVDPAGEEQIHGAAPYWRLALQHGWGSSYISVGAFGMDAAVYPGRDMSEGTDRIRDVGFDATFQRDFDDRNTVVAGARYIHETQRLNASDALGLAVNPSNALDTASVNVSYALDATYGLTLGYFGIWGTGDEALYDAEPIGGSAAQKPNSQGYTVEATYTPFGKDGSWLSPWVNIRLGLQYVGYTRFNGASRNYDGFGRSAGANDTVFGYIWLAF